MKPPGKLALIKDSWSISAIVLWEISELSELGRSEIDLEYPELVRTLARIQTGSLTLEVCRTIQTLDFKGDSADEIIGSTHRTPGLSGDTGPANPTIQRVPLVF